MHYITSDFLLFLQNDTDRKTMTGGHGLVVTARWVVLADLSWSPVWSPTTLT